MDQADRASALEAIRNQYLADQTVIAEKDVSILEIWPLVNIFDFQCITFKRNVTQPVQNDWNS